MILCGGAILCIEGCWAASLASTHWIHILNYGNQKCLQTLPDVSSGAKSAQVENHWFMSKPVPAVFSVICNKQKAITAHMNDTFDHVLEIF